MMKKAALGIFLGAILSIHCAVAQPPRNSPMVPSPSAAPPVVVPPIVVPPIVVPPDSEIRQILIDRIDKEWQSVGIVVGVIEPAAYFSATSSRNWRRIVPTASGCSQGA
jgi:hypothetical protein